MAGVDDAILELLQVLGLQLNKSIWPAPPGRPIVWLESVLMSKEYSPILMGEHMLREFADVVRSMSRGVMKVFIYNI